MDNDLGFPSASESHHISMGRTDGERDTVFRRMGLLEGSRPVQKSQDRAITGRRALHVLQPVSNARSGATGFACAASLTSRWIFLFLKLADLQGITLV